MTATPNELDVSKNVDKARDVADSLRDEAANRLAQARDAAVTGAAAGAENAKNRAADEVSSVATALRRASHELRAGSPQERSFGQVAEVLAEMSDGLRDKDLRDLVSEASGYARRNPMAFLGGAALLGFAAARFAKAGQGRDSDSDDHYHPKLHEAAEFNMPPRSAAPAGAWPSDQKDLETS